MVDKTLDKAAILCRRGIGTAPGALSNGRIELTVPVCQLQVDDVVVLFYKASKPMILRQ